MMLRLTTLLLAALLCGGKPGMQVADICVEKPVPESAIRDIDLWTG